MLRKLRVLTIAARIPIVVLLLGSIATAFQEATPWKTFSSREGKFSVLMPAEPKAEAKAVDSAVGKLTLYTFSSSSSSGSYVMVSYGDYPMDPLETQKEKVLDGVVNGVLTSLGGEKVSEEKITLNGATYSDSVPVQYPGREFAARKTLTGSDLVFNWRIYLVGRRLYQMAIVTNKADSKSPEIAKFLTSFELSN